MSLDLSDRSAVLGARGDARDGVRAMLPIMVAYAPLGLVVGAQVAASADPVSAWLGTQPTRCRRGSAPG